MKFSLCHGVSHWWNLKVQDLATKLETQQIPNPDFFTVKYKTVSCRVAEVHVYVHRFFINGV
jgi:hypothetical protein